jgi:hypothetical protein
LDSQEHDTTLASIKENMRKISQEIGLYDPEAGDSFGKELSQEN